MGAGPDMANEFEFLGRASPSGLYRFLEKMSLDDAAVVLAGLKPGQSIQVMAFFPENKQAELMRAMREVRQAGGGNAAETAVKVRQLLADAKAAQPGAMPQPQPDLAAKRPVRESARPKPKQGPQPWIPRTAESSPINGPAVPGKPPSASGDPFKSPLVKAGLMDLIGRAQEKLLPKKKAPAKRESPPVSHSSAGGQTRPPAVEGVFGAGAVKVGGVPRVIGPRSARGPETPPAERAGARRMDGKAILAAILREAGGGVRDAVERDDPSLYRELRGRMFYFDDLIYSEDATLARVFTAAPAKESALALKFAAPVLRERVLRAVSPGRAAVLEDVPRGRTGFDAIEAAQKKVLDVALQLQAAGRILIDPRDPDLAR